MEERYGGGGLRVVFIDSGCGRDLPLKDCVNLSNNSVVDTDDHGAHVHAILASMLPDAELILVKVPETLPDNLLITALNEAMKLSPHIISLSITSEVPSDGSDPTSTYVNHVAEKSLVAVSAGNGGPRMMSIGSPAVAEGALTVGAADVRGRLWRRSSRGPTLDGRWKPNVVAPTGFTPPHAKSRKEVWGTSFAAPIAAAVAAPLVKQLSSPAAAAKILELTASSVDIHAAPPPTLTGLRKASLIRKLIHNWPHLYDPRNFAGMGMVNAAAALKLAETLRSCFSTL
ncbi:MAG: S8 family serine peptidase [Candidatus Caldarchaeum sp.]|nr:S8 family serine peptidase [Candidatus Caldarchaeum sp.]MDW7977340.1 S8 family serine peptidase [Candidatus Caldarchaeum sp.]MDW8359671.1 S8 family serine peptidase [Candidatus Caldarchaeum sp.]